MTKVLGVYDVRHPGGSAHAQRRQAEIRRHCGANALAEPSFDHPDFLDATVEACEHAREGELVVLVGALSDLTLPELPMVSFGEHEWREGWIDYLAQNSIGWSPLTAERIRGNADPTAISRVAVIRSYRRAVQTLAKCLTRVRSSKTMQERSSEPCFVHGRPPYGYKVNKDSGKLEVDTERAQYVRDAFRLVRDGKPVATTATILREACEKAASSGQKPEFWDAVKVRRILANARLYCLGEWKTSLGEVHKVPELAILSASFLDVGIRRVPKTARTDVVPSRRRKGTLGPSAPSTR